MPYFGNYTAPFTWEASSGRWKDARGLFVSFADVDRAMQAAMARAAAVASEATLAVREGRLALSVFQRDMQRAIKSAHLVNAAMAHGGLQRLDGATLARVRATVRAEYGFLARLAAQVQSGEQPLDGRFASRARMYLKAGRQTYTTERGFALEGLGFDQERNRLSASDHCPGCEAETARGWVPINTLKPTGTRTCLSNCNCRIERRKKATGETSTD